MGRPRFITLLSAWCGLVSPTWENYVYHLEWIVLGYPMTLDGGRLNSPIKGLNVFGALVLATAANLLFVFLELVVHQAVGMLHGKRRHTPVPCFQEVSLVTSLAGYSSFSNPSSSPSFMILGIRFLPSILRVIRG